MNNPWMGNIHAFLSFIGNASVVYRPLVGVAYLAVGGWDWAAKSNTNWDTLSAQWLHAPLDWAISVTHSVAVCNTINVCCKTKIDAQPVPSPQPHTVTERDPTALKSLQYISDVRLFSESPAVKVSGCFIAFNELETENSGHLLNICCRGSV